MNSGQHRTTPNAKIPRRQYLRMGRKSANGNEAPRCQRKPRADLKKDEKALQTYEAGRKLKKWPTLVVEKKPYRKSWTNTVKTQNRFSRHSLGGAICAVAILLLAAGAQAQNLFVSFNNGTITQITPSGAQSAFASGLNTPIGLAFDGAGNLFVGNQGNGTITEITPNGTNSSFASGLADPEGRLLTPRPICLWRMVLAATFMSLRTTTGR